MSLTINDIAKMIDLSCVRTDSNANDIVRLAACAEKYNCGQVSVMQCFIPDVRELLKHRPDIRIIGNVSFPSGSDSTSIKTAQAKEMLAAGCSEIDMVMNVGKLLSERYSEVDEDVRAVVEAASAIPVKVIIEVSCLGRKAMEKACEICIASGAAYIKTGTGWMGKGTTCEDIRNIKAIVGNRIRIKASGGIRNLNTLVEMYKIGAERFGVNLESGRNILEEFISYGDSFPCSMIRIPALVTETRRYDGE